MTNDERWALHDMIEVTRGALARNTLHIHPRVFIVQGQVTQPDTAKLVVLVQQFHYMRNERLVTIPQTKWFLHFTKLSNWSNKGYLHESMRRSITEMVAAIEEHIREVKPVTLN